jgi:hypothetical protein
VVTSLNWLMVELALAPLPPAPPEAPAPGTAPNS